MKFHRTSPLTWLLACVMWMASGLGSSVLAATAKDKANDKSAPTKPSGCATRQFRTMALTTHDAIERETAVLAWLKANGSACTLPQIQYIVGNSPQWLGTADTVRVNGIFDELIDAKSVDFVGDKPAPPPPPREDVGTSAQGRPQGPFGPTTVVPPPAGAPNTAVVVASPNGMPSPSTGPAGTPATPSSGQ